MADASTRDRRGLGRGLSALLGDAEPVGPGAAPAGSLVEIPLDAIAPNPDQPRAVIEPEALEALAASIRASGVLQPVVVAPADADGRHELIAGERRWRAARIAGLERVPAVVRAVDARERLELALVENIVREDLSPIDVAQACACLIEDFGQSHGELAGRLGRSPPGDLEPGPPAGAARGRAGDDLRRRPHRGPRPRDPDGRRPGPPDPRGRARRRPGALGARAPRTSPAASRVSRGRPSAGPASPPRSATAALEAFGSAFDTPVRVRTGSRGQVVVELRFADADALSSALERLSAD